MEPRPLRSATRAPLPPMPQVMLGCINRAPFALSAAAGCFHFDSQCGTCSVRGRPTVAFLSAFGLVSPLSQRAKVRGDTMVISSWIADPSGLPSLMNRSRSWGRDIDSCWQSGAKNFILGFEELDLPGERMVRGSSQEQQQALEEGGHRG